MKKTEIVKEDKFYCDICGKETDTEFAVTLNIWDDKEGSSVDSFNCHYDLCYKHMRDYRDFVSETVTKNNKEFIKKFK